MTFVNRGYEDVVRDVLTSLTHGVPHELVDVPLYDPAARPAVALNVVLQRRPVRRVSRLAGELSAVTPGGDPIPYVFTLNDYELAAGPEDPDDLSRIRFLPFGRKPAPGSTLTVNYYPRNVEPSPITDVNVGSVARTLVESIGRELALLYAQLELAYESAFLETATGSSLDRVVALLGLKRYMAGRPVGAVRFGRRTGSPGTITIPPGTPVTDRADTVRYETTETHIMLPNETTAEVRVRGAADDTPIVEQDMLSVVQRAIAGIDQVSNPRPTAAAAQDESDDELRARARGALIASNKGTIGALENGLLQLPDVRAVSVEEFPNGVPGELRVSISLSDPALDALPQTVLDRIEELRPAGVNVLRETAATVALAARVSLVLAGSGLPSTEVERLHGAVRKQLAGVVAKAGVGQRIRTGPLGGAILGDERIVDVTLRLGAKGEDPAAPGADFVPAPGEIVELAEGDIGFEPDVFDAPAPAGGTQVPVDVTATLAVTPLAGADIGAIQAQLRTRLQAYFGSLGAGAAVDSGTLLGVVRDDAQYVVDPLGLRVTLAAAGQFVEVSHGGPSFRVLDGHTFTVSDVTAVAGAPA